MLPYSEIGYMKAFGMSRLQAKRERSIRISNGLEKSLIGMNISKPYSASAIGWRCSD